MAYRIYSSRYNSTQKEELSHYHFKPEQRSSSRTDTCELALVLVLTITDNIVHLIACRWNSTIQLPILYASLPQDAQLAITLWDIEAPGKAAPVGGSTLELFNKKGYVSPSAENVN